MIILIPYREDIHKGFELQMALRSIQKYLKGYTDVLIVGRPPDWYNGRWIYSETNIQFRKQYSIYRKIMEGIELGGIRGEFLFWNDDHLLLSHMGISHFKYWHNGALINETNRDISARVYQALINTLNIFPDGNNFDIHTPIVYDATKFIEVMGDKQDELYVKSMYCNSLEIKGEHMEDCKINSYLEIPQIKQHLKGKLFFSTGENGIKTPMRLFLNEMFPEKSQWEN